MGNCCGGGERVDITSDKNATLQATSYGPRQSQSAVSARDGQTPASVRMTATGPSQTAKPTVEPDYNLQPPLRLPGDSRGVYYQPTDTPSAVLRLAFSDQDGKDQRDSSSLSTSAAATETMTRDSVTVTNTATPPEVTAPTKPENVSDGVTSAAPPRQQDVTYQPRDVMISYSRSDGETMRQIKDELEAQGLTVWVDQSSLETGADFLSKIGEAIIDAKFFICILSESAVRSKYCRDEVALAYVSNTVIYPVNLQSRDHLLPLMDTGLKLQLANYNWTSVTDPDTRLDNIRTLVSTMKAEMDDLADQEPEGGLPGSPTSADASVTNPMTSSEGGEEGVTSPSDVAVTWERDRVQAGGSPVHSPTSDREAPDFKPLKKLRERNRALTTLQGDDVSHVMPEQFWSEQFGAADQVTWDSFTRAFLDVFKTPVKATFTTEDQQQLLDILRRELEIDSDDLIYKYQLIAFCSVHGDMSPLWPRVHEQARESFAMREVFNMDSSVRVEAIENLGKFRSAAVIDALRDLLTDPDANVRAVATVSLSRTNANDPVTIRHILRTLSDKDRLVREAGCLALGHLKARQAISKLSHLWRNDVISHVREAAAVALRQIGGQEVEDVMRVTKVLAEEIRSLTEAKQ